MDIEKKKQLIQDLHGLDIISFPANPDNLLTIPPYKIDLRLLCSHPKLLKFASSMFGESIKESKFDLIAGPYTDIPLATTISLAFDWPMVFVRGERKDHGMERLIEGNFKTGQKVIIVNDEINDVANCLQLIGRLEGSGLKIAGIYVLLDKQFGALEAIKAKGYHTSALITLNDIFLELFQTGKITAPQLEQLKNFLEKQRREFLLKLNSEN